MMSKPRTGYPTRIRLNQPKTNSTQSLIIGDRHAILKVSFWAFIIPQTIKVDPGRPRVNVTFLLKFSAGEYREVMEPEAQSAVSS